MACTVEKGQRGGQENGTNRFKCKKKKQGEKQICCSVATNVAGKPEDNPRIRRPALPRQQLRLPDLPGGIDSQTMTSGGRLGSNGMHGRRRSATDNWEWDYPAHKTKEKNSWGVMIYIYLSLCVASCRQENR